MKNDEPERSFHQYFHDVHGAFTHDSEISTMPAKKGFSERAWEEIINGGMDGKWIDPLLANWKQKPDEPFADVGPILESMLNKGVTREEICRLLRFANYETVFATVMLAAEEELDADALDGVHEELLMADPSGLDGGPGSWPIAPEETKSTKSGKSKKVKPAKPRSPDEPLLKLAKGDDHAFSPAGDVLALSQTSNTSTTIRLFAFPSGELLTEFNSLPNNRGIAYLPDGSAFAVSNHHGAVALHDAKTGKELWSTPKTKLETFQLEVSRDGSQVRWIGTDRLLRRCEARTGKMLPPINFGETTRILKMAQSPDGKTLALSIVEGETSSYSFWDVASDKETTRIPDPNRDAGEFQYLSDGKRFLLRSYRGVRIWNIASQSVEREIPIDKLKSADLSMDETRLAALGFDAAHVIDFATGRVHKTLSMEKLYPFSLVFSPSGKHIVLVTSPKTLVWEIDEWIGAAS